MDTNLLKTAVDLIKNGKKTKGKEIIIELLKTEPNYEVVLYWLAASLENKQGQITCVQKILEINPNNQVAIDALAQLQGYQNSPQKEQMAVNERKYEKVPILC